MGLDMYLYAEMEDADVSGVMALLDEDERREAATVEGVCIYGWEWRRSSPAFDALVARTGVKPDDGSPRFEVCVIGEVATICAVAGYWRKANQIHAWFVEHVQDDVDECQRSPVTREQLGDLRSVCQKVLAASEVVPGTVDAGTVYDAAHPQGAVQLVEGQIIRDPTVAHALLPSRPGFFFGGTDYDQWYYGSVVETVPIIDAALALPESWSFAYRSSW